MRFSSRVLSAYLDGIDARLLQVEADLNVGLHAFSVVGLADKAVSEAKERVSSALKHCGVKPPAQENRRITVNLAPTSVKKSGAHLDLPIALSYLLASEQIKPFSSTETLFAGELSLDGALRPIAGSLNIALLASASRIPTLFVPRANAPEAAIVRGVSVVPVSHLTELIRHLEGSVLLPPEEPLSFSPSYFSSPVSLSDIKGLFAAKRALEVAAAGGHHIIFTGPPGTGKTLLAQTLVSLLPPPTLEESIEITRIYSAAGLTSDVPLITHRPFRSPHHSASPHAIFGGGAYPRPGEMSLAHRGVLFLDEAPEFRRDVLEGLRQPLESGAVQIARAQKSLSFPSRFTLALAMNPCPCGYYGDAERACTCAPSLVSRYQKKLSGPLLDRIDIQLTIPRIPIHELRRAEYDTSEESGSRERVSSARAIQCERMRSLHLPFLTNAELRSRDIDACAALTSEAESFLDTATRSSLLSPRGYYRMLKIARTIADLEASSTVTKSHLAEAFQYRVRQGET